MTQINVTDELGADIRALIDVHDAAGLPLLYQHDPDGDHGFCHVCDEVDSHRPGCAVGQAETALRRAPDAEAV